MPGTAVINIGVVPVNDAPCGAITLLIDGAQDCGNTTCATSVGDPTFANSTPNNTVWYTYTPTVTGPIQFTLARPTSVTTGLLYGWVGIYSAPNTCPTALTFTQVTSSLSYDLTTNPSVILASPSLTAGTTYYFMIDGFSGASGAYCISIQTPPSAPSCTTNTAPVNLATNVSIIPNLTLAWNAAPTATSYDVYFGTVNPPTALLASTAAVTINVTGSSASTTYYWYVVPKNAGGSAVGCVSNVTSFTTSVQCIPTTTNGGTSNDALIDFVLNGEGSTAISVIGAAPIAAPGYIDLTATTTVDLAIGKAYAGNFKVDGSLDKISIWIDYNNNGGFEANELVLNNIASTGAATSTPYSILISSTATAGTYKMRVRSIYSGASPIDPCGGYAYGEAKDFTVNIVATGSPYSVSNIGAGACTNIAITTIDAASNNASAQVPLLDAAGAIVAQVNANGNSLGVITSSLYKNTGAVRQTSGSYYLDRNITITPATQPTSSVNTRLYYTAAELTALQGADPLATSGNMTSTKTPAVCASTFSGAGTFLPQVGNGTLGTAYYLDVQNTSFSTFYLKGNAGALPISIEFFKGYKQGQANTLDWKVSCTSASSVQLTLERSADGRKFDVINNQTESASRCLQGFNYTDNNPLAGANYYRLKISTPDGAFRYSTIVVLLNKDKGFELISVAPNPVQDKAILTLTSAKAGKVEITVSDVAGKIVAKQSATVIAGNNPIPLNFATLGAGTYTISAQNADGEIKNTRFVKF